MNRSFRLSELILAFFQLVVDFIFDVQQLLSQLGLLDLEQVHPGAQ